MNVKVKVGLLWFLSCVLAGALGWYGRTWWPQTTSLVYAVLLAERKEVHVTDADEQILLVAKPGTNARTWRSLNAYSGKLPVFCTNHHEDGTVKEILAVFGGKDRYAWTFRPDGSLETSTTYDERGMGIVRFFDESGKPTARAAQVGRRSVD